MKRMGFLSLLIISSILISQVVHATGLQMLSQTYVANSQTSVDGTPISDYTHTVWGDDWFGDPGESFRYSTVSAFDVLAEAGIPLSNWLQPHDYATARGDWHFRPLHNALLVSFNVDMYSDLAWFIEGSLRLTDVTTSASLLDFSIYCPTCGPLSGTYRFVVDPSHEYEFSMYADVSVSDIGYGQVHVNASVDSVPEPATMLFLGFGLVGLAGVRRKFQS